MLQSVAIPGFEKERKKEKENTKYIVAVMFRVVPKRRVSLTPAARPCKKNTKDQRKRLSQARRRILIHAVMLSGRQADDGSRRTIEAACLAAPHR